MSGTIVGASGTTYAIVGQSYSEALGDTAYVSDAPENIQGGYVGELFKTSAPLTDIGHLQAPVTDSALNTAVTGFGDIYFAVRSDTVGGVETLSPSAHTSMGVADSLTAFLVPYVSAQDYTALADIISSSSFLGGAYTRVLSESLTATVSLASAIGVLIESALKMSSSAASQLTGKSAIDEVVNLLGRLFIALTASVSEALTIAATEAATLLLALPVQERVKLIQVTAAGLEAHPAVQEALALYALTRSTYPATLAETVTLAQTLSTLAYLTAKRAELITTTASVTPQLRLLITVADSAMMIDPPTGQTFDPQQLLQALIQDQVSFGIGYIASNGIWTGWTLNATTQAVSNYAGWDFNSFTQFRGQYLGASRTQGVASLGGPQDGAAAITATLQSAVTDFGNSFLKRVKMAYIGLNSNGVVTLSTTTDDNVERVYQLVPDAPGLHTERVQLARGVMSRYWTFTLQAVGTDFRVDAVSLLPVTLERRI